LMVFGKNRYAEQYFRELLSAETEKLYKVYIAIVKGSPISKIGTLEAGIMSNFANKAAKKRFIIVRKGGKKVITAYQVLEKFNHETFGKCSVLAMKLITGRRHQARATASVLGCPIIGDQLYGGPAYSRVLLHSSYVGFRARLGPDYSVICPPKWGKDKEFPGVEQFLNELPLNK